jgi:hypothetical protein
VAVILDGAVRICLRGRRHICGRHVKRATEQGQWYNRGQLAREGAGTASGCCGAQSTS